MRQKTAAALISQYLNLSNMLHFSQWCHFRSFASNSLMSRAKRTCFDVTSCDAILCAAAFSTLRFRVDLRFIFIFSIWESWVLPCSPLSVAELTHSSPGPMLPQSTTAPLRTLEYSSAAEQGSRAGGDKKTSYTHTHMCKHTRHLSLVLVHPGPVSILITVRSGSWCRKLIWVSICTGAGNLTSNPVWHRSEPLGTGYIWFLLFKKHVRLTMRCFATLKTIKQEYPRVLSNRSSLVSDEISLHHSPAKQEEADQHKASVAALTVISFWFGLWRDCVFQGRSQFSLHNMNTNGGKLNDNIKSVSSKKPSFS